MMPLSSHLRLEVFVRVNGGIYLRHILFILSPVVFWRLVAPAIQLVVLVEPVLLNNTLQDPPLRTSRKWLDLSLLHDFVSQIKNVT